MTVHRLDIKRKKKAILKDLFPICFIALFGSFGFAYIFNSDCISEFNNKASTTRVHIASHSLSLNSISNFKKDPLRIDGNYFSNNPLLFHLNNFNPEAQYTLEIGNGETIEIKSSDFEYIFKQPGPFELNLKVVYPNQPPIIWSKDVIIEDGSQLTYHKNSDSI